MQVEGLFVSYFEAFHIYYGMQVVPVSLNAISAMDLSGSGEITPELRFSLRFLDPNLEAQFQRFIRCKDLPITSALPSLRERLLIFGLTLLLSSCVAVLNFVASYIQDELPGSILAVQCGCLMLFLCAVSVMLMVISLLPADSRKHYTGLGAVVLLSVVVFSLLDSSVTSVLMGKKLALRPTVTSFTPLVLLLTALSHLLACDYLLYFTTSFSSAMLYAVIKLAARTETPCSTILEAIVMCLVSLLLTRRMYFIERSLRLNWVSEAQNPPSTPRNQPKNRSFSSIGQNSISLTSDWEEILSRMTNASHVLVEACGVIVHHDLRSKLKVISRDLTVISAKLAAEGPNLFKLKVEQMNVDIDEEDKAFVQQNFMTSKMSDVNGKATSQRVVEQTMVTPSMFIEYEQVELISTLSQVGRNWNFDMLFLHQATKGNSLCAMGRFCLSKFNLFSKLSINYEIAVNYLSSLESHYKPNPYHNSCHGADVLNSTLFLYEASEIMTFMTELEIMGSVLACLGHDVGHWAVNNRFLVNSRDELAIRYNDVSVLEMMHASTTYSLMQTASHNILHSLPSDSWVIIRKVVLKMILATDMSRHFDMLSAFKATHLTTTTAALSSPDERMEVFEMVIKCADVGHAGKMEELHEKWTMLVCEEFFQQGDLEKQLGLPVSMYCDRDTADIPKVTSTQSQMGFIQNIVLPLYETLNGFLISPSMESVCIRQLHENISFWDKKSKYKRQNTPKSPKKEPNLVPEYHKLSSKIRTFKRYPSLRTVLKLSQQSLPAIV